ncbi:alpha/beta fold hydrolase [Gimibacter soli]|uniref:Alpha/beta hydrolase n=1 Tax=Gimibacter soli TaxID=3024400 RepID=A0AAE9XN68_9PROT|nr:alpha/beta hydrolase [Gimibacter soli]WCL53261.1 alpha/beta hydrolase [Gimibacter soli]
MSYSFETIRLTRPDGDIVVDITGSGPLVVCLHGWSFDRRMWGPLVPLLAPHFRLALVDRRGFGETSAPPGLGCEVDDIAALLDHLGAPACGLIGMSQGGRVALRVSDRLPSRVWGMALISAPLDGFPPPNADEAIPVALYREWAAAGGMDRVRADWVAHPLLQHGGQNDAKELVKSMLASYEGRDLTAPLPTGPAPDIAGRLSKIETPALVVASEHDTGWLHAVADTLVIGLPKASGLRLEGAGHLAAITHPAQVGGAILAFLNSIALPASLRDQC